MYIYISVRASHLPHQFKGLSKPRSPKVCSSIKTYWKVWITQEQHVDITQSLLPSGPLRHVGVGRMKNKSPLTVLYDFTQNTIPTTKRSCVISISPHRA